MKNYNKMKVDALKRKGVKAIDIAVNSAMGTISHDGTFKLAATVGLVQGLKYSGNFNRGIKAGVTTMAVMVSIDVVRNVANNWEVIKNA